MIINENYFIIFPTAVFLGHKMPTKKQLVQIEIRCDAQCDNTPERVLHFTGEEEVLVYPARDVASLAPCSHEEADTIIFAHAMETAKRAYKKINSRNVDTDVGVLAIHVVQQLGVDGLWGWQKLLAIYSMKSKCLAFFHSFTGCDTTSSLFGRRKLWLSVPAITENL